MKPFELFQLRPLPGPDEAELVAQHGLEIQRILPLLGPLFGLGIILFSLWDHWVDPAHAWAAFAVRAGFVLAGSIAYPPTRLPWNAVQRWGYIYWTHSSAIIVSQFMLQNGYLYGLTAIAVCVLTVSVIALRVKTFLLILSVPSLVFVALGAIVMPLFGFLNSLTMYLLSVGLACILMLVIRSFRIRAFLSEKELLRLSRHDSLTGAANRRYLTELAEREVALAMRHGRPLSVAMIDIDHFKKINDTHGHNTGDEVIKLLVKTCIDSLRTIDHFGRIGGEEFACVLPETAATEAVICAERLRRNVEGLGIETSQGRLQFTISIGVAVLDETHGDWRSLLDEADGALYRAKRAGRNRVVLAMHKPGIAPRIIRPSPPSKN
jgi:diguanylate cyclase (GGDEF)-like protein